MNKRLFFVVVIMAVIVGFLIWRYSDAQIVKRQSDMLIKTLNIAGSETKSFRILKTNTFTNLLANSVTCRVDIANYRSNFSYDDLEAQHHLFVNNVDTSSLKANNMIINKLSDSEAKLSADMSWSVTGKGVDRLSENGKLTLLWKKNTAGKWRITLMEINGIDH